MKIVYWNRSKKNLPYDFIELNELAEKADIVSVHLPLNSETERILGVSFFANLRNGSLLVNTARGKILDDVALIDALNNGTLSGYAADVLSVEPPPANHELLTHQKTLITPHIGSLTKSTYDEMCTLSLSNLLAIVRNNPVDKLYLFNTI